MARIINSHYTQQYPTWGDLAREQLRRHGIPYCRDVQDEVRRRLQQLPHVARKAFALNCATRLMTEHERLPPAEQQGFTLGWRPVLDAIRLGLIGDSEAAKQRVGDALQAFYASPYNHNDGQDGPPDADENAAAASIYAAECFRDGDAESAFWASSRAISAASRIAWEDLRLDPNDFVWDPAAEPMPLAKAAMHPAVQEELRQQLADLAELERDGVASLLRRLRT